MSRRGGERVDLLDRTPMPLRPLPERTEQERKENRRTEYAEDRKADVRRWRPTIPEQQLLSVLAMLGERYGEDYAREVKIKEPDGWFLTHVDVAFVDERLAIEVYGGPHHKPFFDPDGTRGQEDAERVAQIEAAGWRVLVITDTELAQKHWPAALAKVQRFLTRSRAEREEMKK